METIGKKPFPDQDQAEQNYLRNHWIGVPIAAAPKQCNIAAYDLSLWGPNRENSRRWPPQAI